MSENFFSKLTTITLNGILNNLFFETYVVKFIGTLEVILTGINTVNKSSVMLLNHTTENIIIKHNSNLSFEGNRFLLPNETDFTLLPQKMVQFKFIDEINSYLMLFNNNSSGTESDPIYSYSPSSNLTSIDINTVKNLEGVVIKGGLFVEISDGNTNIFNIEHGFDNIPQSVFLTRCNIDSIYENITVTNQVIMVTLQVVPPQGNEIKLYWLALK